MDSTDCANQMDALIEERDVLEAQRDNYRQRCEELAAELRQIHSQFKHQLTISKLDPKYPSAFKGESLERMREWKRCIEFVIDEKEDKEEQNKKGTKKEIRKGPKETFSPLGLSGYLSKNHRLTQKYTEYLDPKPKAKNGNGNETVADSPQAESTSAKPSF